MMNQLMHACLIKQVHSPVFPMFMRHTTAKLLYHNMIVILRIPEQLLILLYQI